jgi:CubicO group peptidase (beta-lactamase class C family)
MLRQITLILLLVVATTVQAVSADLPMAKPEDAGFTKEGLEKLTAHFQTYVDEGKLAGLTTLVSRGGKIVHFETYGDQNKANGIKTSDETLFRIYSMTKPITGVAMMMLWEEGKFKLDDPVSKYLPSFKKQRVFAGAGANGKIKTLRVKRKATIRDLMRHTAGLTYGFFGDTPVDRIYRASGMFDPKHNLKALVKALGKQPLMYQPGKAWVYSLAVDVQGRLIEKLSGQSLAKFFETRIFRPLGMDATSFQVRSDQKQLFAEVYGIDKKKGLTAYRGSFYRDFTKAPPFLSGGGGLVSTTGDYWRFAQMVANGGTLDGVRLLKPETVAMMAHDQLPAELQGVGGGKLGLGFGLNFAVVKDLKKAGIDGSVGEYYWGGMANTLFWIDPKKDIVVVLMTNVMPSGIFPLRKEMHKYVYGALAHDH